MGVKIITDSTAYIDVRTLKELDITVIPLSVHFPDVYYKETEVDYEEFYRQIEREGIIPTSSQPARGEVDGILARTVRGGDDVLAIFISSEMSGTYHSALKAREMILQDYPGVRIRIVDSRTNCMAMGLTVIAAARAAREGKTLEEIEEIAYQSMLRTKFYFVPKGLEYLKKGGRIGGAAALLGSILQIKPILYVLDGKTALLERVRGQRAAIGRMLKLLDDDYERYGIRMVMVHHISCPDEAVQLAQTIADRYGLKVSTHPIGPVIGLHVGPGTLAIVYCTENY